MRTLQHPAFRWLIGGQLVSNLGDAVYSVALPLYVLAHHGSTVLLGVALAAYGVPRAGLTLVGGHASDRFKPWSTMLAANLVRAVAVGALALVAATGPARAASLIPIAVVLGAGEGMFLPGSFAIVPQLLSSEDLQPGNGLAFGVTQLAQLAGPALGGVLVAALTASTGFGIDALTFLISAFTLLRIRGHTTGGPSALSPNGAGITVRRLLRTQPILMLMLATDAIINLGAAGLARVALPKLTTGPFGLGADGYGLMLAAMGAGLLTGTIAAALAPPVRRPLLTSTLALLIAAPLIAVVPYAGGPVGAAMTLFLSGALEAFGNVLITTAYQQWAPPDLLGRVMALMMFASMGVLPISALLAGVLVKLAGPVTYFPLVGATVIIGAAIQISSPTWRAFTTSERSYEKARGEFTSQPG